MEARLSLLYARTPNLWLRAKLVEESQPEGYKNSASSTVRGKSFTTVVELAETGPTGPSRRQCQDS